MVQRRATPDISGWTATGSAVEGGSYGGGLCEWLITQTSLFKAAISIAGITNPITYNYRTNNNQYVHMAFGLATASAEPHGSACGRTRSFAVRGPPPSTPILPMHGENDSDVPIAETEQFYIALSDVGVDAVMVRYPREGHGLPRGPAYRRQHRPQYPSGSQNHFRTAQEATPGRSRTIREREVQ